ncbi:MAG: hypothetical protein Q8S02_15040 [Hydrogenophaga sp.]|nr:hypothetical protein [Hydrogenophaga sp.]
MTVTGKVIDTREGQLVLLPSTFRVNVDEFGVRRDDATGELVLTPLPIETESQRQSRGNDGSRLPLAPAALKKT